MEVPNIAFARKGSNMVDAFSIFITVMSLSNALVNIYINSNYHFYLWLIIQNTNEMISKDSFQISNSNWDYLYRSSHWFQNYICIDTWMNPPCFCSLHWNHNYQYPLRIHQFLRIINISNTNLCHLWSHTCTVCCAVSRVSSVAFARIGSNIIETSCIVVAVISLCDAFVNIWVNYIER